MEITASHIKELNSLHAKIIGGLKKTIEDVLEIGSMLSKTQESLPPGDFKKTVLSKLDFSESTAKRYIRCWKSRALIHAKRIVEISDAYALLASPPKPDSVVSEIKIVNRDGGEKPEKGHSDPSKVESCQVPNGSRKEPEIKDAVILDSIGWPIPEKALPYWNRKQEIQDILTSLSSLKGLLKAKQEEDDPMWREVNFSGAIADLSRLWTNIQTAKPYAVCPTCQGKLPDKCAHCRGRGLLSEFRWSAVAKDIKEMRIKMKGQARV